MCDFLLKKKFRCAQKLCLGLFTIVLIGCSVINKDQEHIEVWHWMSDRQEAFEILTKQYKEQTGVVVQFKLINPPNAYTQKINTAIKKKKLPDIYGVLNRKEVFANLVNSGWILDLTDVFKADNAVWEKSFFSRAIDMNRFKGDAYDVKPGIYGVPLDMGGVQLLYNRKLLQQADIFEIPTTFEEWLVVIEALLEKGILPFVAGFRDVWLMECFAFNYAFNIMGEEKVFDTFLGKVPYTDPDWIKVLDVFVVLRDRGVFGAQTIHQDNYLAEKEFALEKAAFTFNGTWAVNVYRLLNHQLDFGVMPLPVVNVNRSMISWGGSESSFVVNAQSQHQQKSIDFLKWITAREQQAFLSAQLNILPVNRGAIVSLSENLMNFLKSIDVSTHPAIWPVHEQWPVQEAFLKGIQSIIIGQSSPQEVAEKVQQIKNRIGVKK